MFEADCSQRMRRQRVSRIKKPACLGAGWVRRVPGQTPAYLALAAGARVLRASVSKWSVTISARGMVPASEPEV